MSIKNILNCKSDYKYNPLTDDFYIQNRKLWLAREGWDSLVLIQDLTEVLEKGKYYSYDSRTGNVYISLEDNNEIDIEIDEF